MTNQYLYGIVEQARPVRLGVRGLDGTSPVRVVVSGDLGALVSTHKTDADLRSLPRETMLRHLLAYQRVVEAAMAGRLVLPVKFGTEVQNANAAREVISQNRTTLDAAFASMRGLVEVEVCATWDIGRVMQQIAREPAVVRTRLAIERRGQPGQEDQVQLGRLVRSRIEARRAAVRERALELLRCLATSVASHALLDDQLVMNEAFLIASADVPELERRVRELDEQLDGQVVFRIIGPLPPYTFCTVEVVRVSAHQMDDARMTLGMNGEKLDDRTVREAYRRAAAAAQRQRKGKASATQPSLGQLKEASELLLGYCHTDATDRGSPAHPGDRWVATIRTTGLDDISSAAFGGGT